MTITVSINVDGRPLWEREIPDEYLELSKTACQVLLLASDYVKSDFEDFRRNAKNVVHNKLNVPNTPIEIIGVNISEFLKEKAEKLAAARAREGAVEVEDKTRPLRFTDLPEYARGKALDTLQQILINTLVQDSALTAMKQGNPRTVEEKTEIVKSAFIKLFDK